MIWYVEQRTRDLLGDTWKVVATLDTEAEAYIRMMELRDATNESYRMRGV